MVSDSFATPWTEAHQGSLPSLSPTVCSNSCPLSRWCYSTISSCHALCLTPSIFPASGSFPVSWLFTSSGQSIRALASVCPVDIQGWLLLGLTGWILLQSKGLSRVFSSTTVQKHQIFSTQQHHSSKASNLQHSAFFMIQLPHLYMTTGKTIALTIWTFVSKMMSLLLNTLSLS